MWTFWPPGRAERRARALQSRASFASSVDKQPRIVTAHESFRATSSSIARIWRQFRTGLAFAVFGVAGAAFAPILLPLAGLSLRGADGRRVRCQWIVSVWFSAFSHLMRLLGLISWEIRGAEKLQSQGQLIIANHPTLIDVVLLLGYIRRTDCIVKSALFRNPATAVPVTWAGYVSNSSPSQLVGDCAERLKQGRSLLIFPEGTRSKPGQAIRIPHAAARIALDSGAPILPVTITCKPITLHKDIPWYDVPERRAHLTIQVGSAYLADEFLEQAPNKAIAARRLSRHWEQQLGTPPPT